MKLGDNKSSPEAVKEMRKLYKKGYSLAEIGRKFGRDHSSIIYWMKKSEDYLPKRKPTIVKAREKIIVLKEKKEIDLTKCQNCGGLKENPKFILTHFCSLKCWDLANGGKERKWLGW